MVKHYPVIAERTYGVRMNHEGRYINMLFAWTPEFRASPLFRCQYADGFGDTFAIQTDIDFVEGIIYDTETGKTGLFLKKKFMEALRESMLDYIAEKDLLEPDKV